MALGPATLNITKHGNCVTKQEVKTGTPDTKKPTVSSGLSLKSGGEIGI
ncbi:hypothetical protein QTO01_20385 [Vibrio mytili]